MMTMVTQKQMYEASNQENKSVANRQRVLSVSFKTPYCQRGWVVHMMMMMMMMMT